MESKRVCVPTPAEVSEKLNALGKSSPAIARALRKKRIKAVKGHSDSCAIALFLKRAFPSRIESIDVNDHSIGWRGKNPDRSKTIGFERIPTPSAIVDFISHFDVGDYPELVRKSNS